MKQRRTIEIVRDEGGRLVAVAPRRPRPPHVETEIARRRFGPIEGETDLFIRPRPRIHDFDALD